MSAEKEAPKLWSHSSNVNFNWLAFLDLGSRDAKSDKHFKHACAIFFPNCAKFWAVDAQRLCNC